MTGPRRPLAPVVPVRAFPVPPREWKWYGQHGHLMCGQWCRFHLCTAVGPWVVSTLGIYVPPMFQNEIQEAAWFREHPDGEPIGASPVPGMPGPCYESMVFVIAGHCDEDACGRCGQPIHHGDDRDQDRYRTAGEATRGHWALCEKWSAIAPDHTLN